MPLGPSSNYSHILPGIMREGKPFNRAVTIFDDFLGEGGGKPAAADAALWLLTGGGAAALATGHGGICAVTGHATAENSVATNDACIRLSSGRRVILEARVQIADSTATTDAFVGLVATTLVPNATGTADDYVGFFRTTADGNWFAGKAKNGGAGVPGSKASGETASEITAAGTKSSDNYQVLRVEINGLDEVKFFIDGKHYTTLTGSINVPDDVDMRMIVAWDGGTSPIVNFDYILCVADR